MKRQWCVYWTGGEYRIGIAGIERRGFGWCGYGPMSHAEAHRLIAHWDAEDHR